jgi:hypothetical protein
MTSLIRKQLACSMPSPTRAVQFTTTRTVCITQRSDPEFCVSYVWVQFIPNGNPSYWGPVFQLRDSFSVNATYLRNWTAWINAFQLQLLNSLHGAGYHLKNCHSAYQTMSCFPYGTRTFIIVFTKARHWTLSWASWLQFAPSTHISLTSVLRYPPTYL